MLRVFVGAALILLAVRCESLPPDDFLCEAAIAHLESCCPGFSPYGIDCRTFGDGCDYQSLPVLKADESQCILHLDCPGVRDRRLCERVPALPPAVSDTDCDGGACYESDYDRPAVCP